MNLIYPNMRDELLEYLEDLSDPKRIVAGTPRSALNEAVHFLFDDTALGSDAHKTIGWFLFDKTEADLVAAVTSALDEVFARHGTAKTDREYCACSEWNGVVAAANEALSTLRARTEGR